MNRIINLMMRELELADKKYADDRMSPEEMKASLDTVKCELAELEREVNRTVIRDKALQKESIQVLAMAYKFVRDVVMIRADAVREAREEAEEMDNIGEVG